MKPSKLEDHLRRCHPDKRSKYLKYFQILKEKLQKRPTMDRMFASTSQRGDNETHKDPVGMALHTQEANMDDTTQTKKHTERAVAGYMTTEKRAKRERGFQRHRLLYLRLKTT
ncbi:hypothetical protein TNCV_3213721 [Trichonephila clavipes]|nr:hypothetical protein TNCV_3213721 [Trichonephila clavipes]